MVNLTQKHTTIIPFSILLQILASPAKKQEKQEVLVKKQEKIGIGSKNRKKQEKIGTGHPVICCSSFVSSQVPCYFVFSLFSQPIPIRLQAQYTLDHVVPGSSPDLQVEGNTTSPLIPYHEQARQHLLSPTLDERL